MAVNPLTSIALIVLAAAALVLAVAVLLLVWRRGFHKLSVDAMGVHASVEAVALTKAAETVNRELNTNGGSSMKDAVVATATRLDDLVQRFDAFDARLTGLEEAVTTPRRH